MNMSEFLNYMTLMLVYLLDAAIVKDYTGSMKQEYISYWQNTLQHSQN